MCSKTSGGMTGVGDHESSAAWMGGGGTATSITYRLTKTSGGFRGPSLDHNAPCPAEQHRSGSRAQSPKQIHLRCARQFGSIFLRDDRSAGAAAVPCQLVRLSST